MIPLLERLRARLLGPSTPQPWPRLPPRVRSLSPRSSLPQGIELPAVGESWLVTYERRLGDSVTVRESVVTGDCRLTVFAADPDGSEVRQALIRWLKRAGRKHLEPWIVELAAELDVDFERLRIALQRTRWGSCSTRGTISLNAGLLFLPTDLVEYVLIHELCHRKQLNHSPAFWSLLATHCSDVPRKARAARRSWSRVPAWAVPVRRSRPRS